MSDERPTKPFPHEKGSPAWERAANAEARAYTVVVPCKACGAPRVHGYACRRCGRE